MMKVVSTVLVLSAFLACGGGGPRRTGEPSDSYIVRATTTDPSRGSITFSISVRSSASEDDVKAAAEDLIAKHRAEYPSIVVKSYPMSADGSGLPYATSVLDGGVINHSFNPKAAPQKIETH
jgi:hypothetical protein